MENITTQLAKIKKVKIDKISFKKLPQTPGVYIFWKKGSVGTPVYIGKSVNLKSRLSSYLNLKLGEKTKALMEDTEFVSYIRVTSELESLLLEARLIRNFKPKYNIISKDDKHPLYIVITNEIFPRIISSRKPIDSETKAVFGPFPSGKNVKTILKLIRKVIAYSDHKLGKKPCIYSQIGLCNPCPNYVFSLREQNNTKTKKQKTLEKILTKTYMQNIKRIQNLLEGKFGLVQKQLFSQMQKFSKKKKFEEAAEVRDKIFALEYITQKQIPADDFLKNPNLTQDIRKKELSHLKKITKLKKLTRIECFDVAHISGVNPTASMVVFYNGEAQNSFYRHFKIRQKNSRSDFDSMTEVAQRRNNNISRWGRPDLIVVDGGLPQIKAFSKVFEKEKIPVVGIAKNPDRLVFFDGLKIKLTNPSLALVVRMRDEAHRFARRYHHHLMKRSFLP